VKLTIHGTKGPLVVKLAGIAGGIRLYDEEIAAACSAGFRVAALDVSGDRRDDPPARTLDWDTYGGEVVEAIERAGAARAILWGTSFGGMIALAASSRRPGRIGGLLLAHPPDPITRPSLHRALLAFATRRGSPDLVARAFFSMAFVGMTSWEGLMPPLWIRAPRLIRASLEAATPAATVRRKLELLFDHPPGLPPPESRMPVEIIAGGWDLVAPLAGARRLASRIPGARVQVIPFAGHAGAYTRPRLHRRAVLQALERLGGSGAY
jgi:pimeloyl-ACP methyl ester carboxylesterase